MLSLDAFSTAQMPQTRSGSAQTHSGSFSAPPRSLATIGGRVPRGMVNEKEGKGKGKGLPPLYLTSGYGPGFYFYAGSARNVDAIVVGVVVVGRVLVSARRVVFVVVVGVSSSRAAAAASRAVAEHRRPTVDVVRAERRRQRRVVGVEHVQFHARLARHPLLRLALVRAQTRVHSVLPAARRRQRVLHTHTQSRHNSLIDCPTNQWRIQERVGGG